MIRNAQKVVHRCLSLLPMWTFVSVELREAGLVLVCSYVPSLSSVEIFFEVTEQGVACVPICVGSGVLQKDLDMLIHVVSAGALPHIRGLLLIHWLGTPHTQMSSLVVEVLFPYIGHEGLRRLLTLVSLEKMEAMSREELDVRVNMLLWLEMNGEYISEAWIELWDLSTDCIQELYTTSRSLFAQVDRSILYTCCSVLTPHAEDSMLFLLLYTILPAYVGCIQNITVKDGVHVLDTYLTMTGAQRARMQERLEVLGDIIGIVHVSNIVFLDQLSNIEFERFCEVVRLFKEVTDTTSVVSAEDICVPREVHLPNMKNLLLEYMTEVQKEETHVDVLQFLKISSELYAKKFTEYLSLLYSAHSEPTSAGIQFENLLRKALSVLGEVNIVALHRYDPEDLHLGYIVHFATGKAYVNCIFRGMLEMQTIISNITNLAGASYLPVSFLNPDIPFVSIQDNGDTFLFAVYRYVEYEAFDYTNIVHRTKLLHTLCSLHQTHPVTRTSLDILAWQRLTSVHRTAIPEELIEIVKTGIVSEEYVVPYYLGHNDLHKGNIGVREGQCILLDMVAVTSMSLPEILAQCMLRAWEAGVSLEDIGGYITQYIHMDVSWREELMTAHNYFYICLWIFIYCKHRPDTVLPSEWSTWQQVHGFYQDLLSKEYCFL